MLGLGPGPEAVEALGPEHVRVDAEALAQGFAEGDRVREDLGTVVGAGPLLAQRPRPEADDPVVVGLLDGERANGEVDIRTW